MQTLLSGSTHSANIAAMTPIRTSLGGGDIVIVGGYLNRQMFNLVTRKEIRKPGDLQGKKIGVASLAGNQRSCDSISSKRMEDSDGGGKFARDRR